MPGFEEALASLWPAMVQQESGGNPNAVSPKGARGLLQTMPMTETDPGFGVSPLDPTKDPTAERYRLGQDYMRAMLDRYGNLPNALAAYNWGPGNVDKWLKAGGDPSQLPRETQGYIRNITGNLSSQETGEPRDEFEAALAELPKTVAEPSTMQGFLPSPDERTPEGTGQGLSQFTEGLLNSFAQMASLPKRVNEGEVDPMSDEAIQWAANTAMDFGTGGLATAPLRPGLGAFGGALWKKRGNFQELIHPAISKEYGVASLHKNADGTFEVMSPDGSSLGVFPDEVTAKRAAESMVDEMAPKMSGLADDVPDEPVTPEQLEWLKQQR